MFFPSLCQGEVRVGLCNILSQHWRENKGLGLPDSFYQHTLFLRLKEIGLNPVFLPLFLLWKLSQDSPKVMFRMFIHDRSKLSFSTSSLTLIPVQATSHNQTKHIWIQTQVSFLISKRLSEPATLDASAWKLSQLPISPSFSIVLAGTAQACF